MTSKKIEHRLEKLPDEPGIYLFYSKEKELIYVGKATSLRSRVRSYFRGKRTPRPIEEMIHEVDDLNWKMTDSVLEAVILESIYIKREQPRYNVLGKDNKSWNYIVIKDEPYPQVKTMRQHDVAQLSAADKKKYQHFFGPYPGLNSKAAMKLLRRMFHFSTCQRAKKKKDAGKPCFYYQIGECLGVCTGEITPTEYKRVVIKPLVTFLKGGKKALVKTLEKRMHKAAKDEKFEEAARLRNQISSLMRIHDVALLNSNFFEDEFKENHSDLKVMRIEGYDISNLGASGKVGSMVVFAHGDPDKKSYRKFKIKTVEGQSDVDCLEEVLQRRLNHEEWPLPQIFLIDGGLPQVNRAKKVLKERGIEVPVVGIAKGPDRKKNEFILGSKRRDIILWVSQEKKVLVQVRDEAHRFALAYQKKTRKIKDK